MKTDRTIGLNEPALWWVGGGICHHNHQVGDILLSLHKYRYRTLSLIILDMRSVDATEANTGYTNWTATQAFLMNI